MTQEKIETAAKTFSVYETGQDDFCAGAIWAFEQAATIIPAQFEFVAILEDGSILYRHNPIKK